MAGREDSVMYCPGWCWLLALAVVSLAVSYSMADWTTWFGGRSNCAVLWRRKLCVSRHPKEDGSLQYSLFSAQELLKLNMCFYYVSATLTVFFFHLLVESCLNQCKIAILLIPFLTEVRKCIVSDVKNPPSKFCSGRDNALSVPVVVCSSVLLPLSYRTRGNQVNGLWA